MRFYSLKTFVFVFNIFVFTNFAHAQTSGKIDDVKTVLLPNGWSLSPVGRSVKLGDLPLNIQVSHNKKMIAITNNGQSTQTIQLIDVKTEKVTDEKIIDKAWYGLQFNCL